MGRTTELFIGLRSLFRLYDKMLKRVCTEHDLTLVEADIISFLRNNPEKDTAADIVELRMLSKGAVSKGVEALIQKSLLERIPDMEDRRKIHLKLRPLAEPVTESIDKVREEFLETVLEGFTKEELETYSSFFSETVQKHEKRNGRKKSIMRHKEQSTERNTDKGFLRTEPLGRLLLKLALPTVAAQLINMLYNIVDRIYIGHIPEIGATALTGVGVCMPLIMIVSAFAALVGYGGAPRASIFMGKQDKESAEKTLGNCFVLQILISVVLTVVLLIWNRDFLMAFGASENTIEYGVNYMNIYALGTIFVEITLGMNAFITAQGFAKTGMLSVLIGAVANIILDPVFIFGFHMDVRGAALATIISQALSCIWVVSFLCGKKTFLKIKRKNLRLVPKIILPCLALGVATFIMQASESVISVCFNSSLQKYGGDIAVGEHAI